MIDPPGSTALVVSEALDGGGSPDRRATVRTEHDVIGFVTRTCFKTGPPGRVGLESEWFIEPFAGARTLDLLRDVVEQAGPLPGGSLVTFEPGGQLELSTACGDDLPHALRLLATDLRHVDALICGQGLRRLGVGVHPIRSPERLLGLPRYAAMERYFDRHGGTERQAGRAMMSTTAALQVCLQAGVDDRDVRRRWHRVHALAPVLVAAFAHSPYVRGRPTGWASTRQRIWGHLDPTRTAPVHDVRTALDADGATDPAEEWAQYALDARVMLHRTPDAPWQVDPGVTLREWVRGDTSAPAPTYDDVAYHLSTLFPPVRPRGWLELRMIDALPDALWRRPDLDVVAARDGVHDDDLHRAATRCVAAALSALPRLGADAALCSAVDRFAERYVDAGRAPADDLLAAPQLHTPEPDREDRR